MARRLVLALLLSITVLLPAALGTPARADRLQDLQQRIATAQAVESRLSSEIGSIEAEIREVPDEVERLAPAGEDRAHAAGRDDRDVAADRIRL